MTELYTDLKISRPGLWFPTIWIYMVPLRIENVFWEESSFWIGLVFVTFPLNYFVYGLNDYFDIASDQLNSRKGNLLFGAKASSKHLNSVPGKMVILLFPFICYFIFKASIAMFVLLGLMILVNILYNLPPYRIKERPPWEILIQIGYVLTAVFSVLLNNVEDMPWQTYVYLSLFAFQAHIAGEIMDIEPDLLSKKNTTATYLGRIKSKYLMLFLLILETYILYFWFRDYLLSGFLGLFSVWLILDIFVFFKNNPYSTYQMRLFGLGMNIMAFVTMAWVLYTGNLLDPVF